MTKKHYQAIASIIYDTIQRSGEINQEHQTQRMDVIQHITNEMSDYFQQDNPKFQREKFLRACGIEI